MPLLAALSHVTWPSYGMYEYEVKRLKYKSRYLVRDADTVQHLKQCTTKMFSIVRIIEFGESEECTLTFPRRGIVFLDPMTCHGKITISITSLPCITGNVDGPTNSVTLSPIQIYIR